MKKHSFIVEDNNTKGGNIKLEFYPKDCPNKYDIVKISFKQIEGAVFDIFLTPDEVLSLSSLIDSGIMFYLLRNKEYDNEITKIKNQDSRKRKVK